jgi:tRNA (cmo5U34)-methyltransferase
MSSTFQGPGVNRYLEGPARQVPGLDGLHRMMSYLLAERVTENGNILVVGAGGGMEIKAMADLHSSWSFDGVDPSADMLRLARQTVADHSKRVSLHEGDVSAAPGGPFDGATCLLVFHHISIEQRQRTLAQVRNRLKPGAPLVLAHVSFAQAEPARTIWIDRHIGFGTAHGITPEKLESARRAMRERLCILDADEEITMLREAGYHDVTQFYAAFTFKGWVAYA